jgi:hypothetical protein
MSYIPIYDCTKKINDFDENDSNVGTLIHKLIIKEIKGQAVKFTINTSDNHNNIEYYDSNPVIYSTAKQK